MVENQHQQISGYRDFNQGTVDAINDVKATETEVARLWNHFCNPTTDDYTVDMHWMSIARTHFQEGFSAMVRAVAQPKDPFTGKV